MDISQLIADIFQICILPLLGILTTYFVKWVESKNEEASKNIEDATLKKYLDLLSQAITDSVIATNQTYVNSLKEQGKFDTEAQEVAFQLTYAAVMNVLTEDAQQCLKEAVGDLDSLITTKIEAEVNNNK